MSLALFLLYLFRTFFNAYNEGEKVLANGHVPYSED